MEKETNIEKKTGAMSRKKFFGLSLMGLLGVTFLGSTRKAFARTAEKAGKIQAKLHPNAVKREAKSVKNG